MLDLDIELTQHTKTAFQQPMTEQSNALMRNVYVLNDDFTPMEFVLELMQSIFKLNAQKSEKVTMEAHYKGRALCGKYAKDLAETMACKAMEIAQKAGHPLMLITSKA